MAVRPQTDERGSEDDLAEDVRARRCAQAQALMREVNEQIHQLASRRPWQTDLCGIVCECVNPECIKLIDIPSEVYANVRRFPTRFILAAEHLLDASERMVDEGTNYIVVEKIGAAAVTAIRLDPRKLGVAR